MGILQRVHAALAGERYCPPEHLEGYKRMAQEVYVVEMEVADSEHAHARVLARAARCLQTMGDALLQDVGEEGGQGRFVASVTHEQTEVWYGRIPDLLIAARQEAAYAGSARVTLPVRLNKRVESHHACPPEHLIGLQRAADELESLLSSKIQLARGQGEPYKETILLAEEARTRRRTGDAIVGRITTGQHVPAESHEEAEESYWAALTSYFVTAQGLEDPTVLNHPAAVATRPCKLDADDVWRVTSGAAKQEIRASGEWREAERDLRELWDQHCITPEEREYEVTVEELLRSGVIHEDGYWYCCPFQSCYRVVRGPVHVIGRTVREGHVFVWEYGEDGDPGHFTQAPSFNAAPSRQYCGDDG